jgi:hypothetical protein
VRRAERRVPIVVERTPADPAGAEVVGAKKVPDVLVGPIEDRVNPRQGRPASVCGREDVEAR